MKSRHTQCPNMLNSMIVLYMQKTVGEVVPPHIAAEVYGWMTDEQLIVFQLVYGR